MVELKRVKVFVVEDTETRFMDRARYLSLVAPEKESPRIVIGELEVAGTSEMIDLLLRFVESF